MKKRVTLSLEPEYVKFLDELAEEQGASRSAALEELLSRHIRQREEERLARLAEEFFSEQEPPEERAEREDWERLSLEVLAREDESQ